jgi:hypothetical protein
MSDYTLRGFSDDSPDNNNFYNFEYSDSDRQDRYGRFKRSERYDRQNRYKYDIESRLSRLIRRFKSSNIQIYDGTSNVHLFIRYITSMINCYKINEMLQILSLYFENDVKT